MRFSEWSSDCGSSYLGAAEIPAVRPQAFDGPQPQQRGADIDATVGGIGTPRRRGICQREKPGEKDETRDARQQPPGRGAEPQPAPEGEASRDLCHGGAM